MTDTAVDYPAQDTEIKTSGEQITLALSAPIAPSAAVVALLSVRPNPANPRTFFDAKAMAELTASVQQNGIYQPILVRPLDPPEDTGFGDPIHYEIVAGERRYRAAMDAGLTDIPVVIRTFSSKLEILIASFTENLQRETMPPGDEANAVKALIEELGTQDKVAKKLGVAQSWVAKRIAITKLPKEVRDIINRGELTLNHGVELAVLVVGHLPKLIELCSDAVEKKWSTDELHEQVRSYREKDEREAREREAALQPSLLETVETVVAEQTDATNGEEDPAVAREKFLAAVGAVDADMAKDEGEVTGDGGRITFVFDSAEQVDGKEDPFLATDADTDTDSDEDEDEPDGQEIASRFAASLGDDPQPTPTPLRQPVTAPAPAKPTIPADRDELVSPFSYLCLSALTERRNQKYPDNPTPMRDMLESILGAVAEEWDIDTEGLEMAAQNA